MCSYLTAFLAAKEAASREQSLPPYPLPQTHTAEQCTSDMVQDVSALPDGSVWRQAPFPEHTDPAQVK